MRYRLMELLKEYGRYPKKTCPKWGSNEPCKGCKYDLGEECDYDGRIADHLLANGVIVQAKGHWIETKREWDFDPFYYIDYQCSACGMREQNKSPFCRWCGTQMEAERSNENAE